MQIVGYDRDVGAGAALVLAEDGWVHRIPLAPDTDLGYALARRHCAGMVSGEKHTPCDSSVAPWCGTHEESWICARCTGSCLKDEMDCHQRHAIYLAAFAPATFKVGVTKLSRLETRLYEQGADRGAHLRTVANGRIARELEADIAEEVSDRVRVPEKLRGLGRRVDEAAWGELLSQFEVIRTIELSYDLAIDRPPTPETMARGTVLGTKGRLLVLDRGGSTYGVDMRDLVGHELEEGPADRDRQVSLGSYT